MKIVTVIPLEKSPFAQELTYFTVKEVAPGNIVAVTLRNKKILAFVISVENASEMKSDIKGMDFNLKKVLDVKEETIFSPELLNSIFLACNYFATNKNIGLGYFIPSILKTNYDEILKIKLAREEKPIKSIDEPRQEKLLLQIPLEDRISVYKTLIRENFAAKKSVFLVLPTEQDILRFSNMLSRGIEQFTFSINGGLSPKKMLAIIKNIISASHPILIVSTTPFLSIPRDDIGLIILEHESSSAYKTVTRPHFDLRTFIEIYASQTNTRLIMSDTLLRFETIGRLNQDQLSSLHPVSYRIDFNDRLKILPKGKKFEIFAPESITEMKHSLSKKNNIFVFALRKGLATMTVCRDCAHIVDCKNCGAPVVLYLSRDGKKRMFICNRCKEEMPDDTFCKNCASWNLMPLGIGTDTVQENLKELIKSEDIPKVKIFKLDKETAKTREGALKIIKEFEAEKGAILVGTEMAMFYIENNVSLSVIASFESLWGIPNFKMSEKILQLIISASAKTDRNLIIQTKNTDDPALRAIESGNLVSFIREELKDREMFNYPPYNKFIKITHLGDKESSIKARDDIKRLFEEYNPEVFGGFVAKSKNKYITNALIKLEPRKWGLPDLLIQSRIDEHLLSKLLSLPMDFEVSVDPEDLL